MILKCDSCGNVYESNIRQFPGAPCGVQQCPGTLRIYGMPVLVQCNHCGNVYASPPREVGGICGVSQCNGTLLLRPYQFGR